MTAEEHGVRARLLCASALVCWKDLGRAVWRGEALIAPHASLLPLAPCSRAFTKGREEFCRGLCFGSVLPLTANPPCFPGTRAMPPRHLQGMRGGQILSGGHPPPKGCGLGPTRGDAAGPAAGESLFSLSFPLPLPFSLPLITLSAFSSKLSCDIK